jgi:hypothetical protein
MKKDNFSVPGMLVMILGLSAFSFVAAGCASAPKVPPVALGLTVEEALRKYIGPNPQNWGEDKVTYVYYLDPLQFDAFKAELDAGGEYYETGSRTEKNRDWEQGQTLARGAVRADGRFELQLGTEDNSVVGYTYEKLDPKKESPVALGPKLEEALHKYMSPQAQTWGDDDGFTYVYFLDPDHFEEFKVELVSSQYCKYGDNRIS